MNTYPQDTYDLLAGALGQNSNRKLQGFLDDVLAVKYNSLDIAGFPMANDMLLDFTYEQVQKELKMNCMATYTDLDSPAIPLSTEGFSLETGKIPRMKMTEVFNEDKLRKQLIFNKLYGSSSDEAIAKAVNNLFITLDTLIGGHTNSLTYQRHQVVSTGAFTLSATNNPRGIKGITFASHVPGTNKTALAGENRWWKVLTGSTYSSEGSTCDPKQDLIDMVDAAELKGLTAFHFEIDKLYAKQVVNHSKIKLAIGYYLNPEAVSDAAATQITTNLTFERKMQILGELVGAPFTTIDSIVSVEKTVAGVITRPQFRAFEANKIVLVPNGNIGETLTVLPIKLDGGTYGYFYGGKLLLTIDYDYVQKVQGFYTEMTSLVVPNLPQYMWYLTPYATA
jgi:hypothetical protein